MGACVVWGANFVVVKQALEEIPPLAFNGLRFPAAAAILLFLQWRTRGFASLRPVLGRVVLLGLVGNLLYQVFFIYGLSLTRAGQASLFSSTTPLFTLVIAAITGKDRAGPRAVLGVLLAAGGVAMLLRESLVGAFAARGFWAGDLLLLGSASSWAVYTVYSQPLLVRLSPLALTSVSMAAGALPILLLGLPQILTLEVSSISAGAWGGVAYSSLLALVVSYVIWSRAIHMLGSTRTAIYVNVVPLVAVVVAWWWRGEVLTPLQAAGGLAVLVGIAVSRRRGRDRSAGPSPQRVAGAGHGR